MMTPFKFAVMIFISLLLTILFFSMKSANAHTMEIVVLYKRFIHQIEKFY